MVVDKLGLHCVIVSDHELYYMNWDDTKVYNIAEIKDINQISTTKVGNQQRYLIDEQPCNITAVDLALEPGEGDIFDLVFGT